MDSSPHSSVLVISCCDLAPSFVVKLILENEGLPVCSKLVEGVEAYPWHITTKYYETDVLLYTLSERRLLPESLAKGVQAVILVFDSLKDDGLKRVESWQSFVQGYEADVSILVCNRCTENPSSGVSKLAAQEWCVQRGYELVELDPELDEEWEAEQDFIETTGIKRVVQALHAHIWPDLTLKERKEPTTMSALLHGGADSVHQDMAELRLDHLSPDLALGNIEQRLDELLSCGSDSDFTQLFGELQTMKERVSALPSDQRKACAEQVVMAFWSAIGGDADEISEPPTPS